jgi:hypothetical protein
MGSGQIIDMSDSLLTLAQQLEQYTLQHPKEVLIVTLQDVTGQPDEVVIFRGFSSSLMQPTAFDPDVPVIPADATIVRIDRLQAPYLPESPVYLQQGLTLSEFLEQIS